MDNLALLVRLDAKKGKETEVEKFICDSVADIQNESATSTWHALKLAPSTYIIFDTFPDDEGRQAHLSGKVAETGSLVSRFKTGDLIFAMADMTRNGAEAEYVVLKTDAAARVPGTISLEQAAAVPLAALTAWMMLFDKANLQPGQHILIHAASGGVGSFAVQLAKIAGAYVAGTTSEANIDYVKSLGADEIINYKAEDFSGRLKDYDVVLDTIGGETQKKSFKVLKREGTF